MVKSKVRFDGLDVAAMVAYWNRIALGRRVINIYNGTSGDMYLFKLDKIAGEQSNLILVIESGVRFHSTEKRYENPGMPSQFCSKLRKHLRGLRLEHVRQLGNKDRVVHLVFGSGDSQRHSLLLEFYARGNIVLTNASFEILSLLRNHEYNNVKVAVGHVYPITYATTTTAAGTNDTDQATGDHNNSPDQGPQTLLASSDPMAWFRQQQGLEQNGDASTNNQTTDETTNTKKGKGATSPWKTLLLNTESGVSHYGPSLLDHCILKASVQSKTPNDLTSSEWNVLQSTLREEGERIFKALDNSEEARGYILYQPKPTETTSKTEEQNSVSTTPQSAFDDKLLLEFQPHLLEQHKSLLHIEYESFDKAVDAFFSHIEGQKRMLRAEGQQIAAQQKLERIRNDQEQRVEALIEQHQVLKRQAEVVELNAVMVDNAIQVVNSALDSGMDWEQLEELIHVEQSQNHNPVALLIHKLDLENDAILLRLPTEDYDDNDDDNDNDEASNTKESKQRTVDITISLKETAHGNASALFARYRASKEKSQKTIEASEKALKAAEETARRQLEEAQNRKSHISQSIQTKRKPLWFEKFHWFITSDNYLVIAGRDAQQNEQLVKRYLRPGDAYLHADVHGAASCILRAKRSRQEKNGKTTPLPLSDQALREAGNFTICKSSAWKSRMVTSAWWVESHQVSKTAPTGEYLTVGSFMVRGKKNFLPPSQLEMGLAVLFKLGDEESIARHKNERRDFALMQVEYEEDEELDVTMPYKEKSVAKPARTLPPVVEEPQQGPAKQKSNEKNQSTKKMENNADFPTISSDKFDIETTQEEQSNVLAAAGREVHASQDQTDLDGSENPEEEENEELSSEAKNPSPNAEPKKKKGLSVRERKLIRKYGSLEAAAEAENERANDDDNQSEASVATSLNTNSSFQTNGLSQKRGKRAKMKRMMKKYKDQDEEDRELALLALHAGEKSKKRDKKKGPATTKTQRQAAAETIAILHKDPAKVVESFPQEVQDILSECVAVPVGDNNDTDEVDIRWDKFDADTLEQLQALESEEAILAAVKRLLRLKLSTRIDNFSASLAGIIRTIKKYGHQDLETDPTTASGEGKRKTRAEKQAESAAWKQTMAEEGVVDQDEDEDNVDDTIELSKLTGKPHPDDLIPFAVPVCGPYQTLSQYSFRVKLTPGNLKRGKAAKQAVDMFLKDTGKSLGSDRNRELIKKIADNDWVQVICADVKIAAPGASKATKKQKATKKKK